MAYQARRLQQLEAEQQQPPCPLPKPHNVYQGHGHIHSAAGGKHGRHGANKLHLPAPEFLLSEVSATVVLLLNVFCW